MNMKNMIIKALVIGAVAVSCLGGATIANAKEIKIDTNVKAIGYSQSPVRKSHIYTLDNSAEVVINDKYKVYELFVEELSDWSVVCDSKEELIEYVKAYSKHKNDYKMYDNYNVTYEEECCDITLSNGVTVIKSEDIDTKDVYLPIFGGLPYKSSTLEDAKKVVDTYLECINWGM